MARAGNDLGLAVAEHEVCIPWNKNNDVETVGFKDFPKMVLNLK